MGRLSETTRWTWVCRLTGLGLLISDSIQGSLTWESGAIYLGLIFGPNAVLGDVERRRREGS